MYKIGQKVQILNTDNKPITGYIVKMEINPLEEINVASESKERIIYTIRTYKSFYPYDYHCTERDIKNADD